MRKKSDIELEGILSQMESSFITTFGKELSKEDFERVLLNYHKELVDKFIMSRVNGLDPQSISFLLSKKLVITKQAPPKIEIVLPPKEEQKPVALKVKDEKAKGIKKGKN